MMMMYITPKHDTHTHRLEPVHALTQVQSAFVDQFRADLEPMLCTTKATLRKGGYPPRGLPIRRKCVKVHKDVSDAIGPIAKKYTPLVGCSVWHWKKKGTPMPCLRPYHLFVLFTHSIRKFHYLGVG
jgi:hypothetical protein